MYSIETYRFLFPRLLKAIIACSNITRNLFRIIDPLTNHIRPSFFGLPNGVSPTFRFIFQSNLSLDLHTCPIIQLYILLRRNLFIYLRKKILLYCLFIFRLLSFCPFSSHRICVLEERSFRECPSCCSRRFSKSDTFY